MVFSGMYNNKLYLIKVEKLLRLQIDDLQFFQRNALSKGLNNPPTHMYRSHFTYEIVL